MSLGGTDMYLTEQEIMTQHIALEKTYAYLSGMQEKIRGFFSTAKHRKFVFLGSGSSYMLAKSGQRMFAACPDTAAAAISGGDYLINSVYYGETIKDGIIITLSRSGQTSEIVRAVKYIKEHYGNPVISISMKDNNDIMPYSDFNLTLDWCYDKSVCQTRTVTNLYLSLLMLAAIYSGDDDLEVSGRAAAEQNQAFREAYRPALKSIAEKNWDNAVILADGALNGIAEEGALAFTEISMLPGRQFNLLDYRHGPIVLSDEKTLTIAVLNPGAERLQSAMVEDLKSHNGILITVSAETENQYGADAHICVDGTGRFEAWGIPLIGMIQMLAYEKSLLLGRNPDAPAGLDAFITL